MLDIDRKVKLCVVVTDPMNLWSLYRDQFLFLKRKGFDVTAVASPGVEHELLRKSGIKTVKIPMRKEPALFCDFVSFFRLTLFFILNRFDIVSVSTPKASLLAGLSAFITKQRKIIFTVRGRVYENKKGVSRSFYQSIDRLICFFSDAVFSISKEIMDDFVEKGVCNKEKIFIIGSGSSNGVDLSRFSKTSEVVKKGLAVRRGFGIKDDEIVILYSGRIRKDKGVEELVSAFSQVSSKRGKVHLIIQGKPDCVDPVSDETIIEIEKNPLIHRADWCYDVEKFFSAANIFAFPSHREGFGNVAIEASAMELPVVAFNVVGCRESVIDNQTGILSKRINANSFEESLTILVDSPDLRSKMGKYGRERVEREFDSHKVWDDLFIKYIEVVK